MFFHARQVLLFALTSTWAVRLLSHFSSRLAEKRTKKRLNGNRKKSRASFVYSLYMSMLAFAYCVPSTLVDSIRDVKQRSIAFRDVFGVSLWLLGFIMETVSDSQLKKFRNKMSNNKRIFKGGLWKLMRHPNVIGNVISIWGLFILSSSTILNKEWYSIIAPLFLTAMQLFVTGIPLLEQKMEHKEWIDGEFELYKKMTGKYLPITEMWQNWEMTEREQDQIQQYPEEHSNNRFLLNRNSDNERRSDLNEERWLQTHYSQRDQGNDSRQFGQILSRSVAPSSSLMKSRAYPTHLYFREDEDESEDEREEKDNYGYRRSADYAKNARKSQKAEQSEDKSRQSRSQRRSSPNHRPSVIERSPKNDRKSVEHQTHPSHKATDSSNKASSAAAQYATSSLLIPMKLRSNRVIHADNDTAEMMAKHIDRPRLSSRYAREEGAGI
ncbi:putative steroid 5-alpha reductase [Monocercomonoides exilis]|uniref:putative steroid 5-alpha reductase n=1 Tax=Monocercomonoides exilis TaxID=2049356 RepID=UPI00355A4420|nr:putative steroid 5-alpha reductase [Monocercomonoides exilis]|eukprot:MONOS_2323.1-p1 / transcript=MONOS_2323.1 / gene=MONOS_2323 / organism=Monocercomonoides_exilis_PA203 / gene_product=putative membrane protein / transcript_product=putative membrane protein / location=Mono_scaffold00047:120287-121660(+) / protein_length=438 / sequence_SO=supercontig / SO=protein_coding / is_pseudo=false